MDHACSQCNKIFSNKKCLLQHNRNVHSIYCKEKDRRRDETTNCYSCKYCKKEYKISQSRWFHEKKCSVKNKQKLLLQEIENEKLETKKKLGEIIRIEELEKQNESLQKIIQNKIISDNKEHKRMEELKIQNESLYKTLQQVINDDGKLQLENQNIILQKEKDLLRENTILKQYPKNTQCVYYGMIDNTGANNEILIKFGNSNSLSDRVEQHKRTFSNFRLVNAFKVDNKLQIENAIKTHHLLTTLKLPIKINEKTQTEILNVTNISFEKLDEIIQDIIINNEYNPEKYKKLLFDFEILQREHELLKMEYEKINNGLMIST
jgi:hypothetical protein